MKPEDLKQEISARFKQIQADKRLELQKQELADQEEVTHLEVQKNQKQLILQRYNILKQSTIDLFNFVNDAVLEGQGQVTDWCQLSKVDETTWIPGPPGTPSTVPDSAHVDLTNVEFTTIHLPESGFVSMGIWYRSRQHPTNLPPGRGIPPLAPDSITENVGDYTKGIQMCLYMIANQEMPPLHSIVIPKVETTSFPAPEFILDPPGEISMQLNLPPKPHNLYSILGISETEKELKPLDQWKQDLTTYFQGPVFNQLEKNLIASIE